jgi:cob(I)alamin adenosyltransferase
MRTGYIQVYTGEGKGKTTAAFGLAFRAAGAGLGVYIGQFVKGRGESLHQAAARFGEQMVVEQYGLEPFIRGEPSDAARETASAGLSRASAIIASGAYDLVVLDEICVALHLRLVSLEKLLDTLRTRPSHVEVVLTGRHAPPALIDTADLVTEMRMVKHYYQRGVAARRGIEM